MIHLTTINILGQPSGILDLKKGCDILGQPNGILDLKKGCDKTLRNIPTVSEDQLRPVQKFVEIALII